MHQIEGHIAWRYLFSKKSHHAINIVSGVSAAAVGVVTAAMVCVLSVLNGFGSLVEKMFSQMDPDLKITAAEGKYFDLTDPAIATVLTWPGLDIVSQAIEETALITYQDHQTPAHVMGVDTLFRQLTEIDSIISDGYYCTFDGGFYRAVLGRGLAAQIGINPHFVGGLNLYAPKRTEEVSLLRPDEAFHEETAFIAGTFAVNQVKYDDSYMIIDIQQARRLFEYDSTMVTSLQLHLADPSSLRHVKKELRRRLGDAYVVQDRYEQQVDFFRMLRVEKLLTAMLLVFILLIACFNIIGSLSMLILDKKESIAILSDLGADDEMIRRIFRYEGWLICSLGAGIGLVVGVVVCLIQQHYGIITLGSGTEYIISAYPVQVQPWDIVIIAAAVLILGWLSAWYPVKHLHHE